MTNQEPPNTEILFSINTLPKDPEVLKAIRRKINKILGEKNLDLNEELLENLAVAKKLRNRLCGVFDYEPDYAQSGARYTNNEDEEILTEEIKDSAKISAISTFSSIISNIVKMQEVVFSQQANSLLQDVVVEVLGEYNEEAKEKVLEMFKEKVKELERVMR